MPILFYGNDIYIVSYSEFLQEYKKINPEGKSVLKMLTDGFDLSCSILAIAEIRKKEIETHKNDYNSRLNSFDFFEKDAQGIIQELLVVFSELYYCNKLSISGKNGYRYSIVEFLLPHDHLYLPKDSSISISDKLLSVSFSIKEVREVRGLVNNFVVHLDNLLLHFCYDVVTGKGIKIFPHDYSFWNGKIEKGYQICDYDYVFDRERPSKRFLRKYRRNGFLVVLNC